MRIKVLGIGACGLWLLSAGCRHAIVTRTIPPVIGESQRASNLSPYFLRDKAEGYREYLEKYPNDPVEERSWVQSRLSEIDRPDDGCNDAVRAASALEVAKKQALISRNSNLRYYLADTIQGYEEYLQKHLTDRPDDVAWAHTRLNTLRRRLDECHCMVTLVEQISISRGEVRKLRADSTDDSIESLYLQLPVQKGEFETSAEFEVRANQVPRGTFAFPVRSNRVTYDADTEEFQVQVEYLPWIDTHMH